MKNNEIICGIYKIKSPSNKVYIGQSIDIYKRWKYYLGLKCKKQSKLYNSLNYYGPENHEFEILIKCDRCDLNKYEKYYVDLFNSTDIDCGLNLKDGGGAKGKLSEEARISLSKRVRASYKNPKGYSYNKKCNKYVSRIDFEGKRFQLGRFDNEIDAIESYSIAIKNIENNTFIDYYKSIKPVKTGFYLNKTINKWCTFVKINNKNKCISYLNKKESASFIYNAFINGCSESELIDIIKETRIKDKDINN